MATIISIGITTSEGNVVDKNFNAAREEVSCNLKLPTDIKSPIFILDYDAALANCNYIHCPEFNRYYYITDITVEPGGVMTISTAVDVLKSNVDEIKNLTADIMRQEGVGFTDLADDLLTCETGLDQVFYAFKGGDAKFFDNLGKKYIIINK